LRLFSFFFYVFLLNFNKVNFKPGFKLNCTATFD